MRKFPKPVVLVSRCLEFDNVRYNGQVIPSQIVRDMIPFVDFIKVCPEVEIGLGVPRETLRIIKQDGEYRLVQPKTGEDLTEKMNTFTSEFLDELGDMDGFIFKGLSPSMGIEDVKVYSGISMSPVIEKSAGLFAGEVIARYPGYPIEENERLRNSHIRHHFLTQLYTFTTFRQVKKESSLEGLLKFHKNNRFLFMSYNTEILVEMSELLGSGKKVNQLFSEYESLLKQLMRKPGSLDLKMGTARNMFSMFEDTTPAENSFFEDMLGRYSNNRISEDCVIELLRMFASRSFGEDAYEYSFLYPYPEGLKALVDEKREKEYWDK
ncbi:DUF523 and DUF1722 domain-containing protein [uncultured Methanolobus sp.]|uniref:YbgA family protein n=1 Tax=uncultured Methanolobus sp. TaxID=218300 RepID=UPI0029C861FB|nr:DUF523 and DUF1722 domain-containing protein [uncultured Methanolobus sp.]